MPAKTCDTFVATIYIAGDYDTARNIIRQYCMDVGDCYTVERVCYAYTGGEEDGVRVQRINYPRFPLSANEIWGRAETLAQRLLKGLCQQSYSIVATDRTAWFSTRGEE